MRYTKRVLAVCMSVIFAVGLAGCGKKKVEDTANVVYQFGDCDVTYGEYYIYGKTVEEDYQKTYGNGVWGLEMTTDDGKRTVKDVTIDDIIESINRVKVLVHHAEDMNISLSDSEKAEIENEAETFYNGLTEADLKKTEITKDLVKQVMEENAIAKKVYNKEITEYDFEISEEEARMTTFYDLVFECYSIDKDGTVKEFTDEKKATQLQKANEALSSLAQDEDVTYQDIVDKYKLQYSNSYTMAKAEMVEEYGESVADKILAMSDGEVSTVIQSQYGYHIFKMIKSNDEELTKKNKEEIIARKQKEYFSGVYEDWLKSYDSHFNISEDVNMDLAKKFPFDK
ncbi:MAG: peptidyl-prolyl cis-trans isomerase [Lachnospiraceae bacterium]|nr:peptidyl-prolyl cis-trans isomerase [Lachnospiraceae bacterium]HCJ06954.1 hypothetical protein [Lachnospiraceae bacterium]